MLRISLYFVLATLASICVDAATVPQAPIPRHISTLKSRGSKTYSSTKLREDLTSILKWAGDTENLNPEQQTETISAILDSAARFYPDVDQQMICRSILADIKAESDFEPNNISGAREDSGRSYGLMQVSPEENGAQELDLFKKHYQTGNSYSGLSSLKDYVNGTKTTYKLDVQGLTIDDLFRPWINIHVATWIQSNLGRTSSRDPSDWVGYAQLGGGNGNSGRRRSIMLAERDRQLMVQSESSFKKTATPTSTASTPASTPKKISYPKSLRTAFGSWVAGPGKNEGDETGYKKSGDDISPQYLTAIMEGVQHLYNDKSLNRSWLSKITLKAGTIDYKSY